MSYNTKNYTEQGGNVTHIGGSLVFEDGSSVEGLDAGKEKKGLVRQGASVAEAQGDFPTSDEFNALLASLRDAGIIAPE